jgi:hypothetical protein
MKIDICPGPWMSLSGTGRRTLIRVLFIYSQYTITVVSPYPNEQYWSDEAQNDIKRHIATLLCENNLLLITGAGLAIILAILFGINFLTF